MRRTILTLAAAALALVAACGPGDTTVPAGGDPGDMRPPAELNVVGVVQEECDDMGGQFDSQFRICLDVDY